MSAPDPWPAIGYPRLRTDARGWLRPTDDWLGGLLDRPELALIEDSCQAERTLHRALRSDPSRAVTPAELDALRDPDARENYRHWLNWRDALRATGTLEAWLLKRFRGGPTDVPPLFVDLAIQAIVRHLLDGDGDAWAWRAAELLFRPQRITLHDGHVLAGDLETLDRQRQTQGLGELGRLLAEAQAPLKPLDLPVLNEANASTCLAHSARPGAASMFLLDLTLELRHDLGHGLAFQLVDARSGLHALARVLERWVAHLLGVIVRIEPRTKIDDPKWRWHLGLDQESSRLLDDLYLGRDVEPARMERLLGLFRLRFEDPTAMRPDVAGRPVYLGLMTDSERVLRLKPQNLLVNLPLADPH